eukprot:jgi/Ulvmu1/3596/UM017_0008.1
MLTIPLLTIPLRCSWVHPLIWAFVGVFVLWAGFMQIVGWMEQVTHEGEPLIDFLRDNMEVTEQPVDLSEEQYDAILAAGRLTPEESHHGPPGGSKFKVPQLYDFTAPGSTVQLFISYHMVFFVIGVAGWACYYLLSPPASVWKLNNRMRSVFARPAMPFRWWAAWFSNLSVGELFVYILLIILPKLTMGITRFEERAETWDAGKVSDVNGIGEDFNVGFWLGIDWLIQLPLLFAFAARGSLLNTYLGVKYGTMLKWHRWLGIITLIEIVLHGVLYQALWLSGSWAVWVREMKRFDMGHVSNLPGAVAWGGAVLMLTFAWPITRRNAYRLFYYSHIIGAAVFMVFGAMHHRNTWLYAAAGLVIYGIDVAYRLYQTSLPVTVSVTTSPATNIITVRIPVRGDVEYCDGGHVWLSIPRLDTYDYHPFSVISTSACPEWRSTMLLQCKVYDKWTRRMAEAANNGFFAGPVDAKIQGPYDGHNMAGHEIDTYTAKLFITGGVGIAAVLPMLQRMALHMERSEKSAGGAKSARIVVVHAARTPAEVMLAAPLLKHAAVVDLRLHYTGSTGALTATQHTLPAPLPCEATSRSSTLTGSGKDVELANRDNGTRSGAAFYPVKPMPGKWESLFVWTMSWFLSFWILVMAESWEDSSYMSQSGAISKKDKYNRKDYRMAWFVFAMTLTVPFVPFALIAMWRLVRRFGFVSGASSGSSTCSDMGGVVASREDSISMPGAPGADVTAGVTGHSDVASIEITAGKAALSLNTLVATQVPLQAGRPDIAGAINAVAASRTNGACMGVWSAGPKAMNNIVYETAGRIGGDVRLFPLAYEM